MSPNYAPGDLVLVTLHPVSKASKGYCAKFSPRRDGPYVILKQYGPASYKVAAQENPNIPVGTYHTSLLEPYRGESTSPPKPVQPLRQRGRPKKSQQEKNSAQVVTEPKRLRGRPKKTHVSCLLAGTSSESEGELVTLTTN